jgi:Na+-translocating ferredoxin:NAD+ oxidoreductase RnfG subunit
MAKLFQNTWFKCITVLLLIACISGGLLAVLNEILYVPASERTERAIKKIYGEVKSYGVLLDVDQGDDAWVYQDGEQSLGEISKIYTVGDVNADSYDVLFKSEGEQGYKNGTITVWVKVVLTKDQQPKIDKVILESYKKQTLMSKLGADYYAKFTDVTVDYMNGELFFANPEQGNNPVSGATYSAQAGCNAVNAVIKCIENKGWEK